MIRSCFRIVGIVTATDVDANRSTSANRCDKIGVGLIGMGRKRKFFPNHFTDIRKILFALKISDKIDIVWKAQDICLEGKRCFSLYC